MVLPVGVGARELKAFYDREGYAGPFRAFDGVELEETGLVSVIRSLRARAGERETEWLWGRNRHLDVAAVARACSLERVVDCVRAILGQDLVLWRSQIFAFSARDAGMGWHRDEYETCLGSSCRSHCSVQIGLVTSTRGNGLSIVPGSHEWDRDALLSKGFTPAANVLYPEWNIARDTDVRDVPLEAGEFIVFHPGLLHASVWGRTLRLAGKSRLRARVARWSRSATAACSLTAPRRYAITLRIATTSTTILPEAFARTPARSRPVLLSGTESSGSNGLGTSRSTRGAML